MSKRLSTDAFRQTHKDGDPGVADELVLMAVPAELAASPTEDRTVDFVLSTGSVDRGGDTIDQSGWKLDRYRQNPVVLYAHDYTMLPVGKGRNLRIEDGQLKGSVIFTPPNMAKFNDTVFDMVKGGFLNAVSVGFMPTKWHWTEDTERRMGIDFLEQELLEFSIVPVPANSQALIEARALGIELDPLLGWARKLLGLNDDFEMVARDRLAEYVAAEAELAQLKTAQLVEPSVTKFPRLTQRAIELAQLKRA